MSYLTDESIYNYSIAVNKEYATGIKTVSQFVLSMNPKEIETVCVSSLNYSNNFNHTTDTIE